MTGTRAKPGEDSGKPGEDLKSLILEMKSTMGENFKILNQKFDSLSASIAALKQENTEIKAEMNRLLQMVNQREQHSRNMSLRINGLKLSADAEKSALKTAEAIYDQLLYPILSEAVKDNVIDEVPKLMQTVEFAHQLPSKKSVSSNPNQIIVRMQSRLIRSLVFKYKKKLLHAPHLKGVYISDDLTALNYRKMMDCKRDPSVQTAWSTGGHIYYTKKTDPSVKIRLQ